MTLAADMADDLTSMFDVDEFAVAATWSGGGTVNVIHDRDYLRLFGIVDSSGPSALAIAADMPTAAQGQTLTIGGTGFTITGVEPDGHGLIVLKLRLS
jgi:hypothetical protein